jgi:hypothetical protein
MLRTAPSALAASAIHRIAYTRLRAFDQLDHTVPLPDNDGNDGSDDAEGQKG